MDDLLLIVAQGHIRPNLQRPMNVNRDISHMTTQFARPWESDVKHQHQNWLDVYANKPHNFGLPYRPIHFWVLWNLAYERWSQSKSKSSTVVILNMTYSQQNGRIRRLMRQWTGIHQINQSRLHKFRSITTAKHRIHLYPPLPSPYSRKHFVNHILWTDNPSFIQRIRRYHDNV
jgi:hypothetical protein